MVSWQDDPNLGAGYVNHVNRVNPSLRRWPHFPSFLTIMSQWGQQQGYQYPMQTGMPPNNSQFQQTPQLQQNAQFQQGYGAPTGGILPQRTGFVSGVQQPGFSGNLQTQPTGFPMQQQPQQTGFAGPGFLQSQPTGYPAMMQQQQNRPAPPPPPVPPIPSQFQQNQTPSFLSQPPPQNRSFLNPSPGPMARPLLPQATGFVDPKLQMMSNTFMPINTAMPYSVTGAPQLPSTLQGGMNLQQSFQQQNQGSAPKISWALSKAEKKQYDQIFRAWDSHNTGFIEGSNAQSVFGQSGLSEQELARIWTLADVDDRGKLNIAEFHIAMGLIYRRLNGNEIPDTLPPELVPPSARDLGGSVDILKDLLKNETRNRSPSAHDTPVSYLKDRSFNSSGSSLDSSRDATIYKHSDDNSANVYTSSRRHVDRNLIRGTHDKSGAGDIDEMRHMLDNSSYMVDKTSRENAARSAEDEALDAERDDLKYRIKRLTEDLDYVSRGPRTASKEEDKRRFERELLQLRHEKLPELERKLKARDERREREQRQWQRDRDRANERSGRYRDERDDYSRGYDDRDRPYSRGSYDDRYRERSRSRDRRDYDRDYKERDYKERDYDRERERDRDSDYRSDYRDRERERERDRDYERPRSPVRARSPPAPPPAAPPSSIRDPPPAPKPVPSPGPSTRNMTPAERQAFAQARAQRLIEERKAKLGLVATPSPAPVDNSVEERLELEKKEAEEKARAAEKEAEERANLRKERLERERALKEGDGTQSTPKVAPAPPAPTPKTVPTPKAAPPPPGPKRAPPPPKPRAIRGAAPAPAPPVPVAAPAPPAPPAEPEVDPEDDAIRQRQEELRKQREARAARLKALEEMEKEEERARLEEERYQARLKALKDRPSVSPAPPSAPAVATPPVVATPTARPVAAVPPPPPPAPSVTTPPVSTPDKSSTNPFSRLMNQGGAAPSPPAAVTSTNPWAKPAAVPAVSTPPVRAPSVPTPVSSGPKSYHTAPQDDDEEDWDMVREKDAEDDSSDDDITASRSVRDDIAQKLFANVLPRPQSAAGSKPSSPAPGATFSPKSESPAPPPPPPPPAVAPPPPTAPAPPPPPPAVGGGPPAPAAPAGDRGALFSAIQGGARLRPTKTVDKSGPQLSGKVLGDSAPPEHITNAPKPPSPPIMASPEPPAMSSRDNRQSVDWYAGMAADAGRVPPPPAVPTTISEDAEYESAEPEPERVEQHAAIPDIQVDTVAEPASDLMADIDMATTFPVRSLYPFQGDGPEDLSFGENLTITAHPSKTGGDWWYGVLDCTGKRGLFPKTYVQEVTRVKAKALFTYTGANPDELSMAEGDEVTVIDQSEEDWWKAEQGGVVFIVPAGYLEQIEDSASLTTASQVSGESADKELNTASVSLNDATTGESPGQNVLDRKDVDEDDASESSDSDYNSFEDSDDEGSAVPETQEERNTREHERQMVLEAAGLIVKKDAKPPPRPPKRKPRRPPPAAPQRQSISSISSKDLPPVPEAESNATRLDDAFERYEAFRLAQSDMGSNRLSVASFETTTSSPTTSVAMSAAPSKESESRSYSAILNFLGRAKTPVDSEPRRTLTISAPILSNPPSDDPARSTSPAFGSSWASLVDKSALDGIPPNERRRQEAIFELIATENAYVRDLQLIVEEFYSKLLPLLDRKAITVIFANIEDILLTNITFMSSLEERQKDCRLYIDRIGDVILNYMSGMGVYMEYCVNQSNAIKVLQDIRDSNADVAALLQRIRDGPSARSLDLSSYLLIPMQRITRYPLLIRQISHYTSAGEEKAAIDESVLTAEKILNHINETIRFQEGQETLKRISQHLWIGQGRLDLTAPTRYMGARRLLKEGVLMKAKSGRKLHAFLCSDILVLTDDKVRNLYRMPIALSEAQVKDLPGNRDDLSFQVTLPYPRGGEAIGLRATSARDCQVWMQAIEDASRRCKDAERRAARKQRF
ncbi:hypothetical protein GYMLUDRAFT_36129 [Collybiopsis luxurians FD-317 M1]|nr:hypothetical protein GYMLUDRAFT_36129 [Collybiopsis luxurians FD-317 M1]